MPVEKKTEYWEKKHEEFATKMLNNIYELRGSYRQLHLFDYFVAQCFLCSRREALFMIQPDV